jgi:hypothetical protein
MVAVNYYKIMQEEDDAESTDRCEKIGGLKGNNAPLYQQYLFMIQS